MVSQVYVADQVKLTQLVFPAMLHQELDTLQKSAPTLEYR